jgi:succinoglycan biosynthesis protein ExoO
MPTVAHDSVSVVITAYNMGWCVARAVTSCLTQSAAVDEIIVVDDCSTDNTEAVVRDLITASDPQIRYLRTDKNVGHLAALRYGIEPAASDWIVLLDGDDELSPKSIEARIAAAMEYNEAIGVKAQLCG